MAYAFTFTPRFQKHFKNLTSQEKKQLKIFYYHPSYIIVSSFNTSARSTLPITLQLR